MISKWPILLPNLVLNFPPTNWRDVSKNSEDSLLIPKGMLISETLTDPDDLRSRGLPFISLKSENSPFLQVEVNAGVIRAAPIFYFHEGDHTIISDSPEFILKQMKTVSLDQLSVLEFLSTGYVTGKRTLIEGLYTLQAGEALHIRDGTMEVGDQYLYNTKKIENKSKEEFQAEFLRITENVFTDLKKDLGGRTAVVSLSGGYDSRLIVAMMKLYDFPNVICLNYGAADNLESRTSKKIAEKLGYPWLYIPYTANMWQSLFDDEIFPHYVRFSHQMVSCSHLQELPSTRQFLKMFPDTKKYVFIPGHAMDFLVGGHISDSLMGNPKFSDIIDYIIKRHYALIGPIKDSSIIDELTKQIKHYSSFCHEPFRIYELWEWRERQAKWIISANRPYQFFDFQWANPLWDIRFVEFWSKIPKYFKYQQVLYDRCLEQGIFNKLGLDFDIAIRERNLRHTIRIKIKDFIRKNLPKKVIDPLALGQNYQFLHQKLMKRYPIGSNQLREILKDHPSLIRAIDKGSHYQVLMLSMIFESIFEKPDLTKKG